jgi:uncharacterized protein
MTDPQDVVGRERRTDVALDGTLIVDADVHINEDPLVLARYCDEPWRAAVEETRHTTRRYLDIPGFAIDWEGIDPPSPGRMPVGVAAGSRDDPVTRVARSGAELNAELADLGVDAAIVFPDHLLTLAALPNPFYACAIARAYNAWLTEEALDDSDRLFGAIVAAPHDPADAAREIRKYAGSPQVRAVYLPTATISPLWGDRRYDPIFQAAEETGLPACFHSVGVIHPNFPHQVHGIETELCRHALVHPFSVMANLVSLISTGVPVRFPNLKIVFTEAGISWVPFIAWRLDKEYGEKRRELPFLDDRPSHYVKQCFFSTQPVEEPDNPKALVALVEAFGGVGPFIFASDWPHHDFDHPRYVLRLPFSPADRARIMGETARELFKLPANIKAPA